MITPDELLQIGDEMKQTVTAAQAENKGRLHNLGAFSKFAAKTFAKINVPEFALYYELIAEQCDKGNFRKASYYVQKLDKLKSQRISEGLDRIERMSGAKKVAEVFQKIGKAIF
jgi:hypothetical protein